MLEPVGPLPPSVYWRRRALALGLAVVLVVGLGFFAANALGGGEDPATTPLAAEPSRSSSAAPPPTSPSTMPSTEPVVPPAAPPPETAVVPPPPPPGPPGPCPDTAIGVAAELGAPEYRSGQRPLLRLIITNIGAVPCIRDVDPALQELLVLSADGVNRLWSSNDCATGGGLDVRTLAPGEQVRSDLTWGGRSSAVGCPSSRDTVPPGDYQVVAKLGPIAGPPVPLRLTP